MEKNQYIIKEGIVNRTSDGLFRYQGWPTVASDEHHRLFAVCSGHRLAHFCPFGKTLLYKSEDGGEHWSAPMIVNDTCLDDRDAGILSLGNNRLLLSWFNHDPKYYEAERSWLESETDAVTHDMAFGLVNGWKHLNREQCRPGSFVRRSEDGGNTWSEPHQVPATAPHGGILLSDGRILYVGKEFYSDRAPGAIVAYVSEDDGNSWKFLSDLPTPEQGDSVTYCEPCALELPNGRILVGLRAQGKGVPHELTVCTCHSDDGGKTWSLPECLGISGAPPHFCLHSTGAVILTYGRREAPVGERARISYDSGETFGEELVLSEGWHGDLGYPSTVELKDGTLLTVYYQKLPKDSWCSILYTKWKLPKAKGEL